MSRGALNKNILATQYETVLVPAKTLAMERGYGNFSPLPNNWPAGGHSPDMSSYVRELPNEPVSTMGDVNLSPMMPVGERRNDRFLYDPKGLIQDPYVKFGLEANHSTPTAVILLFFSRENVKYLQKRVVDEVKRITGNAIAPQSENKLLTIMNNKYQYSLYGYLPSATVHIALPRGEKSCSLRQRLTKLNQATLQEAVKQVVSGVQMYKQYYKDASSLPIPLSRPTLVTNKGSRVLEYNTGFTSGNSRGVDSYNMRNTIVN